MITFKRFAVVKLPYSFGYSVRPAIRRLNGTLLLPCPYKPDDVQRVYRKEHSAVQHAAVLNEEAQLDRDSKVFSLLERWDME